MTLSGRREKQGGAAPLCVCSLLGDQLGGSLPRRGPGSTAVAGALSAAFGDLRNDTQFVKDFILIRGREGEKQKGIVMRVTQKLFQMLRQTVPGGEDVLGPLVQAPQQGGAAEQQEGHAHRGCQDDGDSPGRGCVIIGCLLTDRLAPFPSFVPFGKKPLNSNAVSCPRLQISEDLKVILTGNRPLFIRAVFPILHIISPRVINISHGPCFRFILNFRG